MNRLVRFIPILLGIAAFWYLTWPKPQPHDNLWCVFQASKDDQARYFGGLGDRIKTVRISGLATKAKVDGLYNFQGQALIAASTKELRGTVEGSIFTDNAKQPNGLLLWVKNSAIGSDKLSIATLNKRGMLDFGITQAYLHVGPNLGVSDPLSYPVAMRCLAQIVE